MDELPEWISNFDFEEARRQYEKGFNLNLDLVKLIYGQEEVEAAQETD